MTTDSNSKRITAYYIVQTATGNVMWIGRATDESDAHERHARTAGYASQAVESAVGADDGVRCHELELLSDDGYGRIWISSDGQLAHETYLDGFDEACEIWDGDCDGYDPDKLGYKALIE